MDDDATLATKAEALVAWASGLLGTDGQGIGGPVWELVFFGRDPDAVPRAYFEPDAGTVTYASSAR